MGDRRYYRIVGITAVSVAGLIALWPRIVCFAFAGSWMGGECMGQTNRILRDEVLQNLDHIATAELSYDAAFEGFVACELPTPRPVAELDKKPVPWVDSECWKTLGWKPDGDVRGTYWVEVSGEGFVAYGAIDIDRDGKPAFASTKSGRPAFDNPNEL